MWLCVGDIDGHGEGSDLVISTGIRVRYSLRYMDSIRLQLEFRSSSDVRVMVTYMFRVMVQHG